MFNIHNIGQKISRDLAAITSSKGLNSTTAIAQWRQRHITSPEQDPLIEVDTLPTSYEDISMEIPCLAHYILPSKNGYQAFKEFSAGDVIIDFQTNEQTHGLKEKENLCFLIGGVKYITKKVGRSINESWDIRLHDNDNSIVSLLLTKQV
jgi:hypothetical protein